MQAKMVDKLLRLNQDFYATYAQSFAATRHSVQPGVQRLIPQLMQAEVVLDLGREHGGKHERNEAAVSIHGDTASSSMRSRSPSCDTNAGTWVMPRRRVSRPCWS